MPDPPLIVVIAGPNGAGKSTAAAHLLPPVLPFLNADEVAKTLPGYPSPAVDREAGRRVLEKVDDLERRRADFAVETTLAGKALAARIARMRREGYRSRLYFLWTPSAEFSIERVAARVRAGGHHIPEDTIRRRYRAGIRNLIHLYRPLVDKWPVYDATGSTARTVAEGIMNEVVQVEDPDVWRRMIEESSDD